MPATIENGSTPSIVAQIIELNRSLVKNDIPHAFGGALALAWCTQSARGTIDIDLNIFLDTSFTKKALTALPIGIKWSQQDLAVIENDGQVRLWWAHTPVDLFLNTSNFHETAAKRVRYETFGGEQVPFLACNDLAVFKAFFNRTKDWADLEEMLLANTLDWQRVLGVLTLYLGGDDERVTRLRTLALDLQQGGSNT